MEKTIGMLLVTQSNAKDYFAGICVSSVLFALLCFNVKQVLTTFVR